MELIFSVIGFIIFGLFIRGVFKDETIKDKPTNSWVVFVQLLISLVVGYFVWTTLTKSCSDVKRRYSEDYYRTD
jgi:hypothetical protein